MSDVGPVLEAGETADAIIEAIRSRNANVRVIDRGAYLRVLVPDRCVVPRAEVERALGRPFRLPADLELVMPSFQGTLSMTDEEAVWAWGFDPVTRRTYWHLEDLGRRPTDYEIGSTKLLYYRGRGFEVNVPLAEWYRVHQEDSRLVADDWERFRDPRETTYATYTQLQQTKEAFVDGLIRHAEETGHDRRLSAEWLHELARVLPPLRFPVHGLQMCAAYVGQMAPSGRIVIASLFQAADEMRRVQRLAYRMAELAAVSPELGRDARTRWQHDAIWQPTRELVEKLLVTYDWGEAFVALNLVVKPRFDDLWMTRFAARAAAAGDDLLARIFASLREDCTWHREWSRALAAMAIEDHASNREVIDDWVARWEPLAERAIAPFTGAA